MIRFSDYHRKLPPYITKRLYDLIYEIDFYSRKNIKEYEMIQSVANTNAALIILKESLQKGPVKITFFLAQIDAARDSLQRGNFGPHNGITESWIFLLAYIVFLLNEHTMSNQIYEEVEAA